MGDAFASFRSSVAARVWRASEGGACACARAQGGYVSSPPRHAAPLPPLFTLDQLPPDQRVVHLTKVQANDLVQQLAIEVRRAAPCKGRRWAARSQRATTVLSHHPQTHLLAQPQPLG